MILFSSDWLTVDMCFYFRMTKWQNLLLILFPSVAFFITSIKILAWLRKINCNGPLKRTNVNINSFYKKSKHICPCLSLCVQFSVYFCQCKYMYVCVCGSSCASECDVLICMWRIDKKYFNVEHNELKMLANTQLK